MRNRGYAIAIAALVTASIPLGTSAAASSVGCNLSPVPVPPGLAALIAVGTPVKVKLNAETGAVMSYSVASVGMRGRG